MATDTPRVGSLWQVKNDNGTATYRLESIDRHVDPTYCYRLVLTERTGHYVHATPLGHAMCVELAWFSIRADVRRAA